MLILICGDRNWINSDAIVRELQRFGPTEDIIMHGAARGADSMAGYEARKLGFTVRSYPADWQQYGRSAGLIRNKLMLDQNPDLVLAFHPDIEQSKGTKHMVSIAKAKGTPTEVFNA